MPRASPTSGWAARLLKAGEEGYAHRRGMIDEATLVHDLETLKRDRHSDRMTAGGEAMSEGADPGGVVGDGLVDRVRDHHHRERHIRRCNLLGQDQHVRRDAKRLAGEHATRPAEAVDDLAGDEKRHRTCAIPPASCPNSRAAGTMTPPAPITGSPTKAATVSGPSRRMSVSSSSPARRRRTHSSLSPGLANRQ